MTKLNNLTDDELVGLYVEKGCNKAFDVLLSRCEVKVFTYIKFVVHNEELANDIFQETFVRVITKLQTREYTSSGKFGGWCIRIAHNVMIDYYRSSWNKRVLLPDFENDISNIKADDDLWTCSTEVEMVNLQVLEDVKKMMELLPPLQREIVFMRFYQQLTFKEIADITGVSINTSLGRMRYALLNLRRLAKKYDVYLRLV